MWWPVSECLARRGIVIPIRHIGLPDRFVEQGERAELLAECGLDAEGVFQQLMEWNKGVDSE